MDNEELQILLAELAFDAWLASLEAEDDLVVAQLQQALRSEESEEEHGV